MRVVFAGTPDTAVPTLDALLDSKHDVVAVVTRPDAPAGRRRKITESSVAARAREAGLEVLKPTTINDSEVLDRLRELDAAVGVIVAYGGLLKREALDVFEYGWLNLHFSCLPAWRGAAPVQRSIMAGDEVTGATVFSLVPELDAGPVLGTITQRIDDEHTAGSLLDLLARDGAGLMVDVLDHIEESTITAVRQPEDGVSYAEKLTTDDGRIDWTRPAHVIDRQIRGCTPAPGAWTMLGDERLKIGPVRPTAGHELAPGEVAVAKNSVTVGTGSLDVELSDVQAPGKKLMRAADWARGLHNTDGLTLA